MLRNVGSGDRSGKEDLIRGNRPFIVGDREKFSILGHQLGDMPQLDPDLRVKDWVREVIS